MGMGVRVIAIRGKGVRMGCAGVHDVVEDVFEGWVLLLRVRIVVVRIRRRRVVRGRVRGVLRVIYTCLIWRGVFVCVVRVGGHVRSLAIARSRPGNQKLRFVL